MKQPLQTWQVDNWLYMENNRKPGEFAFLFLFLSLLPGSSDLAQPKLRTIEDRGEKYPEHWNVKHQTQY